MLLHLLLFSLIALHTSSVLQHLLQLFSCLTLLEPFFFPNPILPAPPIWSFESVPFRLISPSSIALIKLISLRELFLMLQVSPKFAYRALIIVPRQFFLLPLLIL